MQLKRELQLSISRNQATEAEAYRLSCDLKTAQNELAEKVWWQYLTLF